MGQLFLHFGVSYAAYAWCSLGVLLLGVAFMIMTRNEDALSQHREEYAR